MNSMPRALLLILFASLLRPLHRAWANRWSLEGGAVVGSFFPIAPGTSLLYGGIGASGTLSYELRHWSFGVRTQGMIANNAPFDLSAGTYNISGDLGRREISLAALARYFFSDSPPTKKWYLEAFFAARQSDFIHSDLIYTTPGSPNYSRLFLRGGGFSIGAGYRPVRGPWFFQVNYELDHFETMEIVGEVNYLHQIVAEPTLNYNYFMNRIFITVGLDVFGR